MKQILMAVLAAALAGAALAQTTQPLFRIERTKNANVVHYEANILKDGAINAKEPVRAYWVMWAKDSTGKTTEGLNLIERMKVYGFNVKLGAAGKPFLMNLKPFPERVIKVYLQDGKARAEMLVDGRPSFFERMFICAKGDSKPDSIKLYGVDIESGDRTYEKFIPKKD